MGQKQKVWVGRVYVSGSECVCECGVCEREGSKEGGKQGGEGREVRGGEGRG